MGADRFIREGAAHGAMPMHRASAATHPMERDAPPSTGFFCPVAALTSSSDTPASHFEGCLATGQNNPGQRVPIYPDPLLLPKDSA